MKRKRFNYVGLSIVLMDNHRSHHKAVGGNPDEKVTFIAAENLLIIWLVPHSSEQTQPLDLGIISVQKRETQKQKKDKNLTSYSNMIIRALTGMQKASTTKNITSTFRAAGSVRTLHGNSAHSILSVDRSAATSVRHWENYQTTPVIEGIHNVQLLKGGVSFFI